jgi:energy-coupling factor transporter ATP-binding protein EcfA2
MAIVELVDVRYVYPGGPEALRGISLRVEAGERVALVGPNGAGKSTLLLALVGLLPASGTIRVGGVTLDRGTVREIRRRVGLVFQDPNDQLFMPTLEEDAAFGPEQLGLPREEAARRAAAALQAVGLAGLGSRAPHHLSGGERRAASLATVLPLDPDALALDEPTNGLDPRARRRTIELLRGLNRTLLIATHDLEMALALCGRAVLIDGGRVAADGRPRVLFADAALMDAHGLEVPASLSLRGGAPPPADVAT